MRVVCWVSSYYLGFSYYTATGSCCIPSKEITRQIACLINCCFVKSWKIPNLVSIVVCSLHQCWLSTISVECHRACCWFPLCGVEGVPNYNVVENLRCLGIFVCRQLCGSVCALPPLECTTYLGGLWWRRHYCSIFVLPQLVSNLSLPIHSGLVGSKLSPI